MLEEIRAIKKSAEYLLINPNIVGVGIGYKTIGGEVTDILSVVVSVVKKVDAKFLWPYNLDSPQKAIPATLGGTPTDVQQTGVIKALEYTGKYRPAPGGVSIGHPKITAGTLGCLVNKNDEIFILSNNHVLANSNEAMIGDIIIQPGTHDGGTAEADKIATLSDFVPVQFLLEECPFAVATVKGLNLLCQFIGSGYRYQASRQQQLEFNLVDAAIAKPIDDSFVENTILAIGTPVGIAEGELGMDIQKTGRTTEHTTGQITQIAATIQIMYGSSIAVFEDQLIAGEMAGGGDSGSAILTMDNHVVGLLFAGGEGTTVFNRIQNVVELLDISI